MKNTTYFSKQKIIVRTVALIYIFKISLNVCLHGRQLDSHICCNMFWLKYWKKIWPPIDP